MTFLQKLRAEEEDMRRAAGLPPLKRKPFPFPKVQVLRVKSSDGKSWVLPWGQFVHSCLERNAEQEVLVLEFVSHKVSISGHDLEVLEELAAGSSLDTLGDGPAKYEAMSATMSCVERIEVQPQ